MKTILLIATITVIIISQLYQPTYGAEEKPMHQKRNVILGLRKVDWSDVERQNEYINCVISAMEHLGKKYSYDELACISGCAFRGCSPKQGVNPSTYHVINDIAVIAHTFRMLGYNFTLHNRSDYETDKKLILDSIDKGIPVLTFHGVAPWAECSIISGYDDDGAVLLGYSAFCDYNGPRDSGYFRFSNWHDGWFKEGNGKILIIGAPTKTPGKEEIIKQSLQMAVKLIRGTASKNKNWLTGYAGHTRYAELVCQDYDGNAEFMELMIACADCNIYQEKLYVAPFLRKAKEVLKDKADVLEQCAKIYDQISDHRREMKKLVHDDMSMGERILDKELRKQYAPHAIKIRDLEKSAADLFEKI